MQMNRREALELLGVLAHAPLIGKLLTPPFGGMVTVVENKNRDNILHFRSHGYHTQHRTENDFAKEALEKYPDATAIYVIFEGQPGERPIRRWRKEWTFPHDFAVERWFEVEMMNGLLTPMREATYL